MQQFQAQSLRDILTTFNALRDTTLRQLAEAQERTSQTLRLAGFSAFTPVSVERKEDEHGGQSLTLRVALPGFNKSDVAVDVAERAIRVTAVHGENHPLGLTGKVELHSPLPFPVDAPRASCELKDGVLTVALPSLQSIAKAVTVPIG